MTVVKLRKSCGFTLLEIMVALTIFSVCAMVLIQQSSRSARQSHYLQTRTLSTWLAENELHQLRSQLEWPEPGKKNKQLDLGSREWQVITVIKETSHQYLRQVDVTVSEYIPNEKTQKFTLSSYLGKH
jgi:general secretion pathway protein I|tara:strand:- start:4762 stop:5145 length:384 start_codon:yes stop_codon:yes gene_type:complete